jgi:preprotein translocase subunit SecD
MDRKIRWRTFWLLVLVALSVVVLVPTVVKSESLPLWFSKVFNKKVQLGLDLQGGLHIVYSVDLDKAVDDKSSEIKRDIEAAMAEKKIAGRVSTPLNPLGAVHVVVDDAANLEKIKAQILADYDEVVEPQPCPAERGARAACFRVSPDYAEGIKKSALEQAVKTVRERIDERGVAEPTVITKGDQVQVELPGLDEEAIERIKGIIERTAKLEFKIVEDNSEYMKNLYRHVAADPRAKELGITAEDEAWTHDETGKQFLDYYLTAKDRKAFFSVAEAKKRNCWNANLPEVGGKVECPVTGRERIQTYLDGLVTQNRALKIDDDHQIGFELVRSEQLDAQGETTWRTYFLRRPVELSGSGVQQASITWNPTTNREEVLVVFNRYGGRRFGELTGANVGKKMAIILDDKVNSAPIIQAAITGGRSTITMGGSNPQVIHAEAEDLVNVLRTGSLPAPLQEESSSVLGPTLGQDAIDKAQLSFVLGGLLVMLVMIWIYRFAGTLSIVALTLNVLFMIAILAGFQATLTLPGIAALVLTLGMAVDANIIIYERIRDELRSGKSVRGAVDAGFERAFGAILDGNLTTAAAGYVLMEYGSGPIRGFAVTLVIGIVTTLFTATWCTRLFFDHYLARQGKTPVLSI